MKELALYHYWRSSASWRVRWALALKQVSVKVHAVDLLSGQEKAEDYKNLNPAGYVPCLITEHGPLGESLAIIEWLDENFSTAPLLPKDSFSRARVRQLAETINSGTQPLINLDITKKLSDDKTVVAAWNQHWIRRGLGAFESLLSETRAGKKSKFCVGDTPSLADICLIPQCYSAERFGVDLKDFPLCQAINREALSTKECQASHPDRYKP